MFVEMSKKSEETLILRDIFSHKHIKDNRKDYEFKDEWQLISDFEEDLLKLGIKL